MKILITGYKGFIGKNLFKYLKKKKIKVYGYDYSTKKFPSVKGFDWVVHLGAISSTTETDLNRIMKQNYFFSIKLVNECINNNVNFQYASSASVYDVKYGFKENSKCNPKSPYSLSKYLFDQYIKKLDHKIQIQGFRYFNVFGANEKNKFEQSSPIYKFIKQAKKNKQINLFYNSNIYKRDFIYVGDVCKVHLKMIKKNISGLFNIGRGKSLSFEKIAKVVAEKHSCSINYIKMPIKIRNHYQKFTKANISKINKHIKINWKDPLDYIKKVDKID